MLIYKPESLELLRQRIDLVEVVSSHVQLKRAGASFKALCPFHDEKSPSFVIQKGDRHYHCFGCGAHGDAIAFLMSHLKLSFVEAIESLAEKFGVVLEKSESGNEIKGPNKVELRQALDKACHFYHFALLHSEEARPALAYLNKRGISLEFIKTFQIGFAPKDGGFLRTLMHAQGYQDEVLENAGLVHAGRAKDFFTDRITFPIRDSLGAVIGFSARKFKEETFGGKYINTSETPLFKKSQVLFGLSYSRQRIAKERKAIIVEGQIDALRLIYTGFNYTVAGQGTAFGEGHVRELMHLGVNQIYLALDSDSAGQEATVKIGNLFQKKGIGVTVISLPQGSDPDSFLREKGAPAFEQLMKQGVEYLAFLVNYFSKKFDPGSPSGKNEIVQTIARMIRSWEQPLMVYESLRKLAELAHVPETLLNIGDVSYGYVKRKGNLAISEVNPDRILETDLLRWLFLAGESQPKLAQVTFANLSAEHLRIPVCRRLFVLYAKAFSEQKPCDFFSIAISSEHAEDQEFFSEILERKINLQKAEPGLIETLRKILEREWMSQRAQITEKIQNHLHSEEELLALVKQYDTIKRTPPEIKLT